MKRMKKIFALLMTMAMVMGLGITGFAETNDTNATIQVSNAEEAALKYMQIVEADTDDPDGWTILDAYKTAFANANIDVDDLEAIVENNQSGSATTGALTSNENLAGLLETLRNMNGTTVENNQFTATSAGLYLVVPYKLGYTYSPTLVYVPVGENNTTITVQTKGAPDQITKSISSDGQSVAAGDEVQYTVSVTYPYISANYTNATFTITDTLTNGTFLIDEDHDVVFSDGITGTVSEANGTSSLMINFDNYDRSKAGTAFTITYWVTVGNNVSSESPLVNEVESSLKLTTDGEETTTKYRVVTKPVKTTIYKIDSEVETEELAGAVFSLYKGIASDYNTAEDKSEFTPIRTNLSTDENGEVVIDGLDAQVDYYIVETQAPEGYQLRTDAIQLTPPDNKDHPTVTTAADENDGVMTVTYSFNDFGSVGVTTVTNTTLSALPETGGMGTTLFTIAGCVIMISAAGLFFATRKKAN